MRAGLGLGILLVAGCATTRVTDAWRDPALRRVKLDRVVAVAMIPEEAARRSAEEVMVAELRSRGIKAVPGYKVLRGEKVEEPADVQRILRGQPFDAAMTFRIVSLEEQAHYVPPSPSVGFWGYYDYWGPYYDEPGFLYLDTVVRVETSLYALEPDGLIWSGITETLEPEGVGDLSEEVLGTVGEQLEDLGVLPAG